MGTLALMGGGVSSAARQAQLAGPDGVPNLDPNAIEGRRAREVAAAVKESLDRAEAVWARPRAMAMAVGGPGGAGSSLEALPAAEAEESDSEEESEMSDDVQCAWPDSPCTPRPTMSCIYPASPPPPYACLSSFPLTGKSKTQELSRADGAEGACHQGLFRTRHLGAVRV